GRDRIGAVLHQQEVARRQASALELQDIGLGLQIRGRRARETDEVRHHVVAVARTEQEGIAPRSADQRIVTLETDDGVVAGAAGDRVVAGGAGKKVIAIAALDRRRTPWRKRSDRAVDVAVVLELAGSDEAAGRIRGRVAVEVDDAATDLSTRHAE